MDADILFWFSFVGQLIGGSLAMVICCFRFCRRLDRPGRKVVFGVGVAVAIVLLDIGVQGLYGLASEVWGLPDRPFVIHLRDTPEILLVFPLAVLVLAGRCVWGVGRGESVWMRRRDVP